jgi:uncharacterized protein YbcV (DUF1398 family)
MNADMIQTLSDCSVKSFTEGLPFPETVKKLMAKGVSAYHADLVRMEKTYYLPNGETRVLPLPMEERPIALTFSADDVQGAVRAIQQGKIDYRTFIERIIDAGTAHYWVYLGGRCAVYTARDGDRYIEPFPKPPGAQ